ncbi:MAG: hypothetical protein ABI723_16795 [Bacteroidia bacterium]
MKYYLAILVTVIISGCSFPDGQNYLKVVGDSVEVPSFEIEVTLNKKAEEKLSNDKETIIIMAYFTGNPKDNIPKKYHDKIDIDGLFLRSYSIELKDKRTARLQGIKFPKELFDLLSDKDIDLLINVCSGRRSTDINLLDCDILQDKMSNVYGKKFTIKGKLIAE